MHASMAKATSHMVDTASAVLALLSVSTADRCLLAVDAKTQLPLALILDGLLYIHERLHLMRAQSLEPTASAEVTPSIIGPSTVGFFTRSISLREPVNQSDPFDFSNHIAQDLPLAHRPTTLSQAVIDDRLRADTRGVLDHNTFELAALMDRYGLALETLASTFFAQLQASGVSLLAMVCPFETRALEFERVHKVNGRFLQNVEVQRQYLIETSLKALHELSSNHIVWVRFFGEQGSGDGVTRGWFDSFASEIAGTGMLHKLTHPPLAVLKASVESKASLHQVLEVIDDSEARSGWCGVWADPLPQLFYEPGHAGFVTPTTHVFKDTPSSMSRWVHNIFLAWFVANLVLHCA